jgi:aminoglycoside 2'-N-acetyltransferase I
MRIELTEDADGVWPEVAPLHREAYPPGDPSTLLWAQVAWENAHRRVLVRDDDGRVVCHVGIYGRTALHDGNPVRLGGVGGVATLPALQRRGLAAAAMRRAEECFRADGVAFALLVCEEKNVPVYRSLGWRRFAGDLFCEQPAGRRRFDWSGAMVLSVAAPAPVTGTIDLCGRPW